MAVDRLSVTVPSELGAKLRELAKARHTAVSTEVTEAIATWVRMAALDLALEESERQFGPLDQREVAEAQAALIKAARRSSRRKHKRKAA
jgi:predicted transcriptional regulator